MQLFGKWLVWFGLLAGTVVSEVNVLEGAEQSHHYRVTRSDYTFSTIFEMATEKQALGSVEKSMFHLTTHYDAYDQYGIFEGEGICRMLSLGLFCTWATEIDIYDEAGEYAGMIDGQVVSTEPAKFSFYDAAGERFAIAYLDKNYMGFLLVDPENSAFVLARLTRNYIIDAVDDWNVAIYQPELLPARMMKIFAAFVCDTQNDFKPDR